MKQFIHGRGGGAGMPRQRSSANINNPAMGKRIAAMRNGGKLSSATRIAKYVDPQIRYTPISASGTMNRCGERAGSSTVTALFMVGGANDGAANSCAMVSNFSDESGTAGATH